MYKILTGKENIDYTQFFTLAPTHHNTRGHSLRLYVSRSTLKTQTEVLQSEGGQRLEWSSTVSRGCFIRQLVQESTRQILERYGHLKLRLHQVINLQGLVWRIVVQWNSSTLHCKIKRGWGLGVQLIIIIQLIQLTQNNTIRAVERLIFLIALIARLIILIAR